MGKFRVDLHIAGKFAVTERVVSNKEDAERVASALNEALRPDQNNLKYVVEKEA